MDKTKSLSMTIDNSTTNYITAIDQLPLIEKPKLLKPKLLKGNIGKIS